MFQVLLVISLLETTKATLVCLYCTDAVAPADCGTVIRCGSHERCYVDAYVSATGSIRYNLGCRDENQCTGTPNLNQRKLIPEFSELLVNETEAEIGKEKDDDIDFYKRSEKMSSGITGSGSKKRANGFLVCSECCNGNLCSSDGCGNNGYSTPRGPICYQCSEQNSPEDCSKIRLCGQGEVCILQKVLNPISHAVRYMTACIGENKCTGEIQRYQELISLLIGKRRTVSKRNSLERGSSCIVQCCKSDLCNINCNENTTKSTFAPVVSSSIPTSSEKTTLPYFTNSTSALTLASATSQTPSFSFPTKTTLYNIPHTVRVLSTYETPEPPTMTSPKLDHVTMTTSFSQHGGRDGCLYNNEFYREGEFWDIGCEKRCKCIDGKNHIHQCQPLCFQWNLPSVCHFSPPLPGKCCPQPECPRYIIIQYPPGYSKN